MTDREVMQQALEAHRMLRNWIEAVPQEVVLPAMPGIDGDWLDEVERNLRAELEQQQAEPPQRKPLTDEEIDKCWYQSGGFTTGFARAIERAHGIGGEV